MAEIMIFKPEPDIEAIPRLDPIREKNLIGSSLEISMIILELSGDYNGTAPHLYFSKFLIILNIRVPFSLKKK